jgi:hypothetical protein
MALRLSRRLRAAFAPRRSVLVVFGLLSLVLVQYVVRRLVFAEPRAALAPLDGLLAALHAPLYALLDPFVAPGTVGDAAALLLFAAYYYLLAVVLAAAWRAGRRALADAGESGR